MRNRLIIKFQSTYLYKVRRKSFFATPPGDGFNPRTYIRYDHAAKISIPGDKEFQSTYLYKVRPFNPMAYLKKCQFQSTYLYKVRLRLLPLIPLLLTFQSTYLYKVRLTKCLITIFIFRFQSTYLYKVRHFNSFFRGVINSFNPRTYIRYDLLKCLRLKNSRSFNPRTYIRYDAPNGDERVTFCRFQSTYLYKVRLTEKVLM